MIGVIREFLKKHGFSTKRSATMDGNKCEDDETAEHVPRKRTRLSHTSDNLSTDNAPVGQPALNRSEYQDQVMVYADSVS